MQKGAARRALFCANFWTVGQSVLDSVGLNFCLLCSKNVRKFLASGNAGPESGNGLLEIRHESRKAGATAL